MKKDSLIKKLILLSFGTVLALHMQMASAQNETSSTTSTVKTTSGNEECVIRDDQ